MNTKELRCPCGHLFAEREGTIVRMTRSNVTVHFGVFEWDCPKCHRKLVVNCLEDTPIDPLWLSRRKAAMA